VGDKVETVKLWTKAVAEYILAHYNAGADAVVHCIPEGCTASEAERTAAGDTADCSESTWHSFLDEVFLEVTFVFPCPVRV